MIQGLLQRILIMLLVAALIACGSDGVDIGPTIADLGEQPPLLETADPEPQVTFQVDRQQVIDSFRALVAVTVGGFMLAAKPESSEQAPSGMVIMKMTADIGRRIL